MKNIKIILISIFLILVISDVVHTVSSQENETKGAIEAQRSIDRSLSIPNTVVSGIGVMVALLMLILTIFGISGYFEITKWREDRRIVETYLEDSKKAAEAIKEIRNQVEKDVPVLAIRIGDEIEKMMEKISPFPLTEKPSKEMMEKLAEFNRKLDSLERYGGSLKPEYYFLRGYYFYYSDKYEPALKDIERAIKLKSDDANAWYYNGIVLYKLSRYEEAPKAYEEAIRLKPEFVEAWFDKGAVLGSLGRYEEALKAYEEVIRLKPGFVEAWLNKGAILGSLGRYEEALKAYEEAVRLKPDDTSKARAWYSCALIYYIRGDKRMALSNLKNAIEMKRFYKEKAKEGAKEGKDFKNLQDDEDFKKLVE